MLNRRRSLGRRSASTAALGREVIDDDTAAAVAEPLPAEEFEVPRPNDRGRAAAKLALLVEPFKKPLMPLLHGRRHSAIVALGGAIALVALVAAQAANAADRLMVNDRVLPDEVHLTGRVHIQAPAGCPIYEPAVTNMAGVDAYYSIRCRHYVQQDGDLVIRVYKNGKLVYHDSILMISGTQPNQGATFDESIFRWEIGNQCGVFYWRVTLYDPYFRTAFNTSQRGSFKC